MTSAIPADIGAAIRIADAIGVLSSYDEFPALARRSVTELRSLLGAAACSVAMFDGDTLTVVAADGAGSAEIIGVNIPVGTGVAGWAAATGQALAVGDVHADPRFAREIAEATGYVPTSLVAVPFLYRSVVVGLVEVLDPTESVEHCMAFAAAVAHPLGVALAAERRLRALGTALLQDAADPETREPAQAPATDAQDLADVVQLLKHLSTIDDDSLSLATAVVQTVLDQRRASS